MPRVSLAANLESRSGSLDKDSLITNGYVDIPSKETPLVVRRPGMDLVVNLGSGAGQGIVGYVDGDGIETLYALQNGVAYFADIPPYTGTYTARAYPLADPTSVPAMCSFGGQLFCIDKTTCAYKTSVYDTSWTTAATGLFGGGLGRAAGTLVVYKNTMWYCGPGASGSTESREVWKSTDGVTWTLLSATALPKTQTRPQILVYNNLLWYIGGTGLGTDATNNNVYSSPDGTTWTEVTTSPAWATTGGATYRTAFSTCVFGGKMWVMGGRLSDTTIKNDVFSSTDGSTWTEVTSGAAWSTRVRAATAVVGPNMIIAGGASAVTGTSDRTDAYTTQDGVTWTVVGSTSLPSYSLGYGGGKAFTHKKVFVIPTDLGSQGYLAPPTASSGGASLGSVETEADDIADFSTDYLGAQIMIRLRNAAYQLVTATNVLTKVTDADYPEITVRGNPYLNGLFYVMDPDGTIWNSAEDDCTSWPATDFISAEFEPDGGVCLAKSGSKIVALGKYTTEFFWDAGLPTGSPLLPVDNGTLLIGCAHANSVCQMEDALIWMAQRKGQGSSFQKGRFVALLSTQGYVEVSTPSINRVLDEDDLATVNSLIMSVAGHSFYCLTLGTIETTLVYDFGSKLWYKWTRCTAGTAVNVSSITQSAGTATATTGAAHGFSDGDPITIAGANQAGYNLTDINVNVTSTTTFTYPVAAATATPATGTITATPVDESTFAFVSSCNYNNMQVLQEANGGKIFEITESVGTDDSVLIDMRIRSKIQDGGAMVNKFVPALELISDKTTTSKYILVRWSDDDYQTWSKFKRMDLSLERTRRTRLGKFRRRSFELRYTYSDDLRIEAIELNPEGGTA